MKEFLDAYNRLEKLCNDLYGQQHGITLYINEMQETPVQRSRTVQGWNDDFRDLRRLRHLRNALVHDLSEQSVMYTQKDIAFLEEFYQRIVKGQDPLTMCRNRRSGAELAGVIAGKLSAPDRKAESASASKRGTSRIIAVLCGTLCVVFVVLVLLGILHLFSGTAGSIPYAGTS